MRTRLLPAPGGPAGTRWVDTAARPARSGLTRAVGAVTGSRHVRAPALPGQRPRAPDGNNLAGPRVHRGASLRARPRARSAPGSTATAALAHSTSAGPPRRGARASAGTGWPSTTACRASPARRRRADRAPGRRRPRGSGVGSGGVMLPNHQPLVVAEQFGTLEALHPGRIDLGIGRAPGTDPRTAAALRRGTDPLGADDFPEQLTELMSYFHGDGPRARPCRPSGNAAGDVAARLQRLQRAGRRPARAAVRVRAPLQRGRTRCPRCSCTGETFRPSAVLSEPYAMIAAAVLAAETDAEARRLALPGALQFLRLRLGRPGLVPTPEEAAAYPYTDEERAFVEDRLAGQVIGAPDTVRDGVRELVERTGGRRADGRDQRARRGRPAALLRAAGRRGDARPGSDPSATRPDTAERCFPGDAAWSSTGAGRRTPRATPTHRVMPKALPHRLTRARVGPIRHRSRVATGATAREQVTVGGGCRWAVHTPARPGPPEAACAVAGSRPGSAGGSRRSPPGPAGAGPGPDEPGPPPPQPARPTGPRSAARLRRLRPVLAGAVITGLAGPLAAVHRRLPAAAGSGPGRRGAAPAGGAGLLRRRQPARPAGTGRRHPGDGADRTGAGARARRRAGRRGPRLLPTPVRLTASTRSPGSTCGRPTITQQYERSWSAELAVAPVRRAGAHRQDLAAARQGRDPRPTTSTSAYFGRGSYGIQAAARPTSARTSPT